MRRRIKSLLLTSLPFMILPSAVWFGSMAYIGGKTYHPLVAILFLWWPVILLTFLVGILLAIMDAILISSYMWRYRPKNPTLGWAAVSLLCLFILYSLVVVTKVGF